MLYDCRPAVPETDLYNAFTRIDPLSMFVGILWPPCMSWRSGRQHGLRSVATHRAGRVTQDDPCGLIGMDGNAP